MISLRVSGGYNPEVFPTITDARRNDLAQITWAWCLLPLNATAPAANASAWTPITPESTDIPTAGPSTASFKIAMGSRPLGTYYLWFRAERGGGQFDVIQIQDDQIRLT